MSKNVLILASNVGLWGEELQAPWDALKKAGFNVTLATPKGITPLPLQLSMDKGFIDPMQNYNVNPAEVVDRINEILDTGEWDTPIKIEDAKMEDYDALVLVGGPGSPLDIVGNAYVHDLCVKAFNQEKVLSFGRVMLIRCTALSFTAKRLWLTPAPGILPAPSITHSFGLRPKTRVRIW